jgi:hypothetical protein
MGPSERSSRITLSASLPETKTREASSLALYPAPFWTVWRSPQPGAAAIRSAAAESRRIRTSPSLPMGIDIR